MLSTTIYFFRHAEVKNPKNIIYGDTVDVSLSEFGKRQMRELAEDLKLREIKPDVIYSSHLLRAQQSAEMMGKIFKEVPIIVAKDLRDTHEPELAEKTLDWLRELQSRGREEYDFPGVEKPQKIVERMMKVVTTIQREHEGKTVFIIGHGDPLAFMRWQMVYSEKNLPSVGKLVEKGFYLEKACGWRVVFDREGKIVREEVVRKREGLVSG